MIKFLAKTLFIHFLVVLLVEGQNPFVAPFLIQNAFADGDAVTIDHLHSQYMALRNRTSGGAPDFEGIMEQLSGPNGQTLLNQGQAFIANPANRTALATPAGQELVNMHNKFARLRKVKNRLDSCMAAPGNEILNSSQFTRALPQRIFSAAFLTPETELPCDPQFFTTESLDGLFGGVSDVITAATAAERVRDLNKLQQTIGDKNLENTVQSLVALEVTYSGADLSSGAPLNDARLNQIVNQVCHGTARSLAGMTNRDKRNYPDRCNREKRNHLKRVAARKQARMIETGARTYTPESAANTIRQSFDELNGKITSSDDYRLVIDRTMIDEVDMENAQSQRAYQTYVQDYGNIVGSHPGMLALTNAVADDLGGRRDQDGRFMGIFGSGGINWSASRFKTHNTSHLSTDLSNSRGVSTINAAISEARNNIIRQASRVHAGEASRQADMANYDPDSWGILANNKNDIIERRTDSLKDIIKHNPTSVGQALMAEPALAGEACAIMKDIAEEMEEDSEMSWLQIGLLIGGLALGGVALIGVGALLLGGAALLVGAAATGGAAVAWGGSVLTALALPGLVYGAVEASEAAYRYNQANQDRQALLDSYLSGSGDAQTIGEYWAAEEAAGNAMWEAGLALGFTIFDLPAAIAIARTLDGVQGARYLQRVSRVFNHIQGSRQLRNVLRGVKEAIGEASLRRVMKELSKFPEAVDYLRQIENLSPDEAVRLFRQGFRICERSCA